MRSDPILLVCPRCKNGLESSPDRYRCAPCDREFPVLFGIPDLRLGGDRYLDLEQERAKARRLSEYASRASFDDLVAFYYEITGDVPEALAVRYRAYVHSGPERAVPILDELGAPSEPADLLDAGCGSGGLLEAASLRYRNVVGVDIALRWLVICQKRLEDTGARARLVCADVEHLPFPPGSFGRVVAADLLEHVSDVSAALGEVNRALTQRGRVWISASNRYSLGPHPTTRLWAIGYLPDAPRAMLVSWFRGVDSLRFTHLLSPFALARSADDAGFRTRSLEPRGASIGATSAYPLSDRILIAIYRWAIRSALLRRLMVLVGPAFELVLEKRS